MQCYNLILSYGFGAPEIKIFCNVSTTRPAKALFYSGADSCMLGSERKDVRNGIRRVVEILIIVMNGDFCIAHVVNHVADSAETVTGIQLKAQIVMVFEFTAKVVEV